jgi:hypothetical protein
LPGSVGDAAVRLETMEGSLLMGVMVGLPRACHIPYEAAAATLLSGERRRAT